MTYNLTLGIEVIAVVYCNALCSVLKSLQQFVCVCAQCKAELAMSGLATE